MEVQPTDRPFPGHSNEPKAIAHIRVASGVRTRVHRIGYIHSSAVLEYFLRGRKEMRGEQEKRKLSSSKDFPKNWDRFYLFDETTTCWWSRWRWQQVIMKWKGCSITRERESGPSDSIQVCLMFLCTFETLRGKWTYLFPFSFPLLISFASLSLFCTLSTLPFDVCFIFTPLLSSL